MQEIQAAEELDRVDEKMKRLLDLFLRHRRELVLAGFLWLLFLFLMAPIDRWSVCRLCGMIRSEHELTLVPFPIALHRDIRIEPTPLSRFLQDRIQQTQCLHDWLFASSCRGVVAGLSRGTGKYVYSVATYAQSLNFLSAVEQFLGSAARDEWIHRALNPDLAKDVELLAVSLPQDGFTSADDFKNWLKEHEGKSTGDTIAHQN